MSDALIAVESLVKEFVVFDRREGVKGVFQDLFHRRHRTLRAVDGVTFAIERGEMVGYIGPNGAGKSTTIKMMTGILTPTSGDVRIAGLVPWQDRRTYSHRIGVVFGQRTQLWWDIAVIESFRLLARIYAVSDADFAARLAELDGILELKPLLHTPVRKLSLGQRMRCDLAASLLHAPPILFLDEPTIGLDVVAKDAVRAFLKQINRRFATTVLLTTHDLRDIEELCSRVIVIDHGKILFDGDLREMKRRHAGRVHVDLELSGAAGPPVVDDVKAVTAGQDVAWDAQGGGRFRASFEREQVRPADLIRAVMARFDVAEVAIHEAEIEEVVKRIYGERGERAV